MQQGGRRGAVGSGLGTVPCVEGPGGVESPLESRMLRSWGTLDVGVQGNVRTQK